MSSSSPPQSTGRVLKANAVRELGDRIAFDYEDFRERCEVYAERIRKEARETIAQAERDSEEIRRQAREEGHSTGREEGLREAKRMIAEQSAAEARRLTDADLATLSPALREAAAAVAREREQWLADWETRAVDMAVAIAERIVHREFELNPERTREAVAPVLELVSGSDRIAVRLNPGDVERLGGRADEVVAALAACGTAVVEPDEDVAPGGCIVTTKHGVVDATIETQLARIAAELHGDAARSGGDPR